MPASASFKIRAMIANENDLPLLYPDVSQVFVQAPLEEEINTPPPTPPSVAGNSLVKS